MEDINNKNKKFTPQNMLFNGIESSVKEIKSKKNILYYIGIFLLNFCSLALCWFFVNRSNAVVHYSDIISSINWKYLIFIFIIVCLILITKVFNTFFILYKMIKKRRFGLIYFANTNKEFFNMVTIYNGGNNIFASMLNKGGIDVQVSVDVLYAKKLFARFALIIYSLILIIVGAIMYITTIKPWILILGIICLIVECIPIILIMIFDINRELVLSMLARLSKTLYKLKLIKDYEKFYKKTSSELFVYSGVLKHVSRWSILYIILNIITQFLRHFILFVIIQSLNFSSGELLLEIMFKCVILDLIINISPLQRGTLIYEILFFTLFANTFFSGYLMWGMVAYRFFDYFIYAIPFLFNLVIDRIKIKINK